jgi:hypothetical protein
VAADDVEDHLLRPLKIVGLHTDPGRDDNSCRDARPACSLRGTRSVASLLVPASGEKVGA